MVQVGIGFRRALDVLVLVDLNGVTGGMVDDRAVVRNQDFVLAYIRFRDEAVLPIRADCGTDFG